MKNLESYVRKMKDYSIILNNVKKIIVEFLKEQGGYANGLETYVKGTVRFNTHSSMEWKTPKSQDLTIREHQRLGYELNDKISRYLDEIDFKDYIYVTSSAGEYGCYYTTVSIKLSTEIGVNDFR